LSTTANGASLARGRNRLARGIKIEDPGPRRDEHEGSGANGFLHDHPCGGCSIDEYPFVAFDRSKSNRALDAARGALERRPALPAQGVPKSHRALGIGVDHQRAAAAGMGAGCQMRRQGALAGAAFARCERNNVHREPSPAATLHGHG
jgi:hypothetical protein